MGKAGKSTKVCSDNKLNKQEETKLSLITSRTKLPIKNDETEIKKKTSKKHSTKIATDDSSSITEKNLKTNTTTKKTDKKLQTQQLGTPGDTAITHQSRRGSNYNAPAESTIKRKKKSIAATTVSPIETSVQKKKKTKTSIQEPVTKESESTSSTEASTSTSEEASDNERPAASTKPLLDGVSSSSSEESDTSEESEKNFATIATESKKKEKTGIEAKKPIKAGWDDSSSSSSSSMESHDSADYSGTEDDQPSTLATTKQNEKSKRPTVKIIDKKISSSTSSSSSDDDSSEDEFQPGKQHQEMAEPEEDDTSSASTSTSKDDEDEETGVTKDPSKSSSSEEEEETAAVTSSMKSRMSSVMNEVDDEDPSILKMWKGRFENSGSAAFPIWELVKSKEETNFEKTPYEVEFDMEEDNNKQMVPVVRLRVSGTKSEESVTKKRYRQYENAPPGGEQHGSSFKRQAVEGNHNKNEVFVGNLPFGTTESQLHELFEESCGKIQKIKLLSQGGAAFIAFEKNESVSSALEWNESEYNGRKLLINLASDKPQRGTGANRTPRGSMGGDTNSTVIVRNIPYSAQKQELETLFEECGQVVHVNLPTFQDSGKLRGFAVVRFSNATEAEAAVKLSGTQFSGRVVTIEIAHPRDGPQGGRSTPRGGQSSFRGRGRGHNQNSNNRSHRMFND